MGQYDLLNPEGADREHGQDGRGNGTTNHEPGVVPWSGVDVLAIIFLVIAGIFLSFRLLLSVLAPSESDIIAHPLISLTFLVLQWVVSLGAAFGYLRIRGYRFSLATLGFRHTAPAMAALMVLAVLFLSYMGSAVYDQFITPQPQQALQEIQPGAYSLFMAILQVVIIAPLAEETFFRGIVHQGLEHRLGFLPAAIFSASIFALAHFQLDIFVPIFLLGFGFAYLVHRTHSLWPSISGHMLFNLIGVIATYATLQQ